MGELVCLPCLCLGCCCLIIKEYFDEEKRLNRRELIDLPDKKYLTTHPEKEDCYLANIIDLYRNTPNNIAIERHLKHAVDTDCYTVELIPIEGRYQIWNTYNQYFDYHK